MTLCSKEEFPLPAFLLAMIQSVPAKLFIVRLMRQWRKTTTCSRHFRADLERRNMWDTPITFGHVFIGMSVMLSLVACALSIGLLAVNKGWIK